jgi:NitT/TauT family transport system permease protein
MTTNKLRDSLPVVVIALALLIVWYIGAYALNAPQAAEALTRAGKPASGWDLVLQTFAMKRPVLPTPDQVVDELYHSMVDFPIDHIRNLLYHAYVTAQSTLVGFVLGTLLGIVLAVGIVHVRTLESSLLPWIVTSQTIPILAIAPMVVVILGNMGFTGLLPKAIISMYLCFFPVTVGMVKGLRSVDAMSLDLMRTYNASTTQILWNLRLPSALPYLFASLKIAITISLVGAIVGELPTGGQAGLGARLLSGSYYGQTAQIWAALVMAAAMSVAFIAAVDGARRLAVPAGGTK